MTQSGTVGTRTGIDVLIQSNFAPLQGMRLGLITNPTGRTQQGQPTVDALFQAPSVTLAALFGPEHGIRAAFDQPMVADAVDDATGLPVFSLYGPRTAPTADQMQTLDAFVYDIQDIGCRFYTYISTLGHVLEAADSAGLPVFVLDRPNPITGARREGPLPDPGRLSFTAHHSLPVRHGLTTGEIARLIHAERGLHCPLTVIACENWQRGDWYDSTGLFWTNPSPNMRSLTQAALYPGVGLLEMTNVSVGRGTDTPFELFGAPWIDARLLASSLNAEELPGIRAVPVEFTPNASKYAGEPCGGVQLLITDRALCDSVQLGMTLGILLRRLYLDRWETEKWGTLLANDRVKDAVLLGMSYAEIAGNWAGSLQAFEERIAGHLLYD